MARKIGKEQKIIKHEFENDELMAYGLKTLGEKFIPRRKEVELRRENRRRERA